MQHSLCVYLFLNQIPNWFHFNCFWRRARVKDHSDIHGFNGLRWEDQQKIKAKLTSSGGICVLCLGYLPYSQSLI